MKVIVLAVCLLTTTSVYGLKDDPFVCNMVVMRLQDSDSSQHEQMFQIKLSNGGEYSVFLPDTAISLTIGDEVWSIKPSQIQHLVQDGWICGECLDDKGEVRFIEYAIAMDHNLKVVFTHDGTDHEFPWYKVSSLLQYPDQEKHGAYGDLIAEGKGQYKVDRNALSSATGRYMGSIPVVSQVGASLGKREVCHVKTYGSLQEIEVGHREGVSLEEISVDENSTDNTESDHEEEIIFLSREDEAFREDFLNEFFYDVSSENFVNHQEEEDFINLIGMDC